MRLTFAEDEFKMIREYLYKNEAFDFVDLLDKKYEIYQQSITSKKRASTKKANQVQIEKSKKKIQDAINLLLLKNEKVTTYKISKEAGVSYNTVVKYYSVPK